MNKNKTYKDSGVEWIGNIPKHWEVKKIAHVTRSVSSGTTPKADNPKYYEQGSINWLIIGDLNDGHITKTKNKITKLAFEKHSALKIYPVNSLLIAMYGSIGKLGILKIPATVNQAISVLSFNDSQASNYWFYVLLTHRQYIISLRYGGVQPNISQEVIKGLKFPVPCDIEEQKLIARYLDRKTGYIDSLLEKIQKKVELLKEQRTSLINQCVTKGLASKVKMKDSGVEWIGRIPEHWSLKKIKFLSERKSGDGFKIELQGSKDGIIPFYKVSDTNNIGNDKYLITSNNYLDPKIVKENNFRIFPKSTIVFPKIGATLKLNKRRILTKNSCIDNNMMGLTITTTDNVEYIHLVMTLINFEMYCFDGTIPSISETQVGRIQVPLPSKNEQQEIVDYVNKRTYFIDIIIEKESSRISILSEYRQSLISSVVTGKIRITEDMI